MFSGIVETIGFIQNVLHMNEGLILQIKPLISFSDIKVGDSIAVNGVCLTVTTFDSATFTVTLVPETLRCTNLQSVTMNQAVNLERSLRADSRIGGHFVQGHVDAITEILDLQTEGDAWLVKMSLPSHLHPYVVNKGFITLDGMSITVIETTTHWFTVTFIPHTQHHTITQHYQIGSKINIEVDMLGKYIEKLMRNNDANRTISC